jgi:hypothetical protein
MKMVKIFPAKSLKISTDVLRQCRLLPKCNAAEFRGASIVAGIVSLKHSFLLMALTEGTILGDGYAIHSESCTCWRN